MHGSLDVVLYGCWVQVWLPDSEGVMALSRHIFFDDAPWLAGGGQRLVHRGIPNGVAEALGCQSLRYHHQVCSSTLQTSTKLFHGSIHFSG